MVPYYFVVLITLAAVRISGEENSTFPIKWQVSDNNRIHWRENCTFRRAGLVIGWKIDSSTEECLQLCLDDLACSHFSYNPSELDRCFLIFASTEWKEIEIENGTCGYVTTRIWRYNSDQKDNKAQVLLQSNCSFGPSPLSIDSESISHCQKACFDDDRCIAFSYKNGNCLMPHKSLHFDQTADYWNVSLLFQYRPTIEFSNGSECGVISTRHWQTGMHNDMDTRPDLPGFIIALYCSFNSSVIVAEYTTIYGPEHCARKCLYNAACSHFNWQRDGSKPCVHMMMALESTKPLIEQENSFGCGYVPSRVWRQSNQSEEQILSRSNCVFSSSSVAADVSTDQSSFDLCQKACISDHQCNSFSFSEENGDLKCILVPYKIANLNRAYMNFKTLFGEDSSLPLISTSSDGDQCGVIASRNWEVNGLFYLKNDCDFSGFDISTSVETNCINYCKSLIACTHFSYHPNGTCNVKKAPGRTSRVWANGSTCGYVTDRLEVVDVITDGMIILIALAIAAIVILLIASIIVFFKYKVKIKNRFFNVKFSKFSKSCK